MINSLQKLILLRYQVQKDETLKHSMNQANKVLRRKLKVLIRVYLILVNQLKQIECKTKVTELESKIPSIIGLMTTAALNAKVIETENETPDTSHFINTQEFYRLTKLSLNARMKEAEKSLASKTEVTNALDLRDKNRKKKKEKFRKFDSSHFLGKMHFEDDGVENYLVFQPVYKFFKMPTDSYMGIALKSKY